MNIIYKVTWQSMWKNKTRTIVTIISVVLSAAMFMAVITGAYSLWQYSIQERVVQGGDFFVQFDYASEEDSINLKEDPDVRYVVDVGVLGYYQYTNEETGRSLSYRVSAVDELFWEKMGLLLSEGRLPENSSEVLVPEQFCELLEVSVGDTVTLDLFNYAEEETELPMIAEQEYREFQTSYTVVGIMEEQDFSLMSEEAFQWAADTVITACDGSQGEVVWHRLYAKTDRPGQASALAERDYGEASYLNQQLLNLYGLTEHTNANRMILLIAAVTTFIVMVAAVNPISNAFAVSVAERTKQFGLMSSIGETKKQIRKSVLFEAVVVCAVAIPIGLLIGYGAMAVVFYAFGQEGIEFLQPLVYGIEGNTELQATTSWLAVLAAVLVCVVTVLFSAWVPAHRASKLTPMEAIRQNEDIKGVFRRGKTGNVSRKWFGLSTVLAKKYYQVSRRKYRATIIALSVGLVLFIATNYLTECLNMIADAMHTDSYDFSTTVPRGSDPYELKAKLERVPGVAEAVLVYEVRKSVIMPYTAYAEEWRNEVLSLEREDPDEGFRVTWIDVAFIEDAVYEEHLRSEGLDPTPYLEGENVIAATGTTSGTFSLDTPEGERVSKKYYGPLWEEGSMVQILDQDMSRLPNELISEDWHGYQSGYEVNDRGEIIFEAYEMLTTEMEEAGAARRFDYFLMEITEGAASGQRNYCYFAYDHETGERGELLLTKTAEVELLQMGACLDERPFGVGVYSDVVLPLSQLEVKDWWSESNGDDCYVMLKAENYKEALRNLKQMRGIGLWDERAESQTARNVTAVIRVVANSIVLLITLISAINVFNVIAANVSLRRRDFAMLRGMGMTNSGIDRMLIAEGLIYGSRALIWSVPIGLVACYVIYRIVRIYYVMTIGFPWQTLLIGIVAVFLIVLVSTFSVMRRIRKDNLIDAIRMENL